VGDTAVTIDGVLYDAFLYATKNPTNGAVSEYQWLVANDEEGHWTLGGVSPTDTLLGRTLRCKYPIEKGETYEMPRLAYNLIDQRWCYADTLTVTCVEDSAWFHTETDSFQCVVYNYRMVFAEDVTGLLDRYEYYVPDIGKVGLYDGGYMPGWGSVPARRSYKWKTELVEAVILNER